MSESDYPFEVFLWKSEKKKELTPDFILEKVGQPSDTPAEIIELDTFFRVATTELDWHTIEDKAIVKKYQNLVKTLKDYLRDLKVVRLGTIAIDVYIIGKTPDGDFAGLATKVVET